ncbi:formate dehydrogenase accessory sulfurtransferase FdhD [Shewanella rhizosphaerae]|uniref:formate dehydrogenase accessory sulfurtransferase FdhD n=1 Tax=Shewanella rhizosphaerae TaxID=2864207 RepID=UPI001C65C6D0|nr:formate dehydrogenase accessory sulfurtransferase FdhD [Shewanella rhizosphaerae]QYK11213.1 formate dehydrogenase accessory sulfurtransferase FdhD [Shewanella rhizosphaerae]
MPCTLPQLSEITEANFSPLSPNQYSYLEMNPQQAMGRNLLASETALSISYNGISHAVMMVTPGHIEDFVKGFSLSSGIVASSREIYEVQLSIGKDSHHAAVEISNRAFWSLKTQRRHMAGASGCGICGVEALEQALPQLVPLTPTTPPDPQLFIGLRERIKDAQILARESGALHAALYVKELGDISLCREDIGRHNALDKLIGAMVTAKTEPQQGFVVMTSRCSLELIHKAVRAKIATLVTLSAPTALTVEWARRHNLNLVHLPKRSTPRLYSPAPTRNNVLALHR